MPALITALVLVLLAVACFGWVREARALASEKTAHNKTCAELVDAMSDAEYWREMNYYSWGQAERALAGLNSERKRATMYAARVQVMEEHGAATYALPVYRSTLRALKAAQ